MNHSYADDVVADRSTPRLLVQHANGHRETLRLSPPLKHTIGRAQDNWLKLADSGSSRQHCVIESHDGEWFVTDSGSSNGTEVDGRIIRTRPLEEGTLIRIGRTWIQFTYDLDLDYVFPQMTSMSGADTQIGESTGGFADVPRKKDVTEGQPVEEESQFVAFDNPPAASSDTATPSRKGTGDRGAKVSPLASTWSRTKPPIEMVGNSPLMQSLRETIAMLAEADAGVLILGETGVGKELVSQDIHRKSRRKSGPYVCVNCAALSESLLESELFGHEKGAFTGATERRVGKFEQADGGTLVLDEIGEMSPTIQTKFLRVLEGHPFERVGGQIPIRVNVRVIASTNRNLERAVIDGEFRRDLFFRLNILDVTVPPLREHRADIAMLSEHFLKQIAIRSHEEPMTITATALERLMVHDWPGNIRELKHLLERAAVFAKGDVIDVADLRFPNCGSQETDDNDTFQEQSLQAVELQHIVRTLDATNWNKSRAASILGIERSTLDRKLKRYKIRRPKPKTTIVPADSDDSDSSDDDFDDSDD